jgi:hypothetical protein
MKFLIFLYLITFHCLLPTTTIMNCFLCRTSTANEANICHSCRKHFKPFLKKEDGQDPDHGCPNCDAFTFPCLNCADYVYEGLGDGSLGPEDFQVFESDRPMSPHDYV